MAEVVEVDSLGVWGYGGSCARGSFNSHLQRDHEVHPNKGRRGGEADDDDEGGTALGAPPLEVEVAGLSGDLEGFPMGPLNDRLVGLQGAPLFSMVPPDGVSDAANGSTGVYKSSKGDIFEEELACNGGAGVAADWGHRGLG